MTKNNASSGSSSSSSSSNNSPQDRKDQRQTNASETSSSSSATATEVNVVTNAATSEVSRTARSLPEDIERLIGEFGAISLSKNALEGFKDFIKEQGITIDYIKGLLLECFDPETNTLNLTSAQDRIELQQQEGEEPQQQMSAADRFATICNFNFPITIAESLTKEAFALTMAEIRQNNPQARLENIRVSPNLDAAYIPKALTNVEGLVKFDCSENQNLKAIETSATSVNCYDCTSLTEANFPMATVVDCIDCTSLTTANFPMATSVNCDSCTSLTRADFPMANNVSCQNCVSLTEANFPIAAGVECYYCVSLTRANFPEATYVDCRVCTSLTEANFPEAIDVDCYGCTSLTTANFPKAIDVNCDGCANIANLITANSQNSPATTVSANSSTSLSSRNLSREQ